MRRLDPDRLNVYVVTSSEPGHRSVALAAIEGGATAVQLRAKELTDHQLLPLAEELGSRCRNAGVLFVVNDRVEVALATGAEAIHVGQGDEAEAVRERVGPDVLVGISVDDAEQTRRAEAAGADYLGVTVWATPTKPDAVPLGPEGLRAVVEATSLPVVGIGGIDVTNAGEVIAAGAAGVVVISAVARANDPVAATRALVEVVMSAKAGAR
jgi:thiamine-phosphate pyrophosphorylase